MTMVPRKCHPFPALGLAALLAIPAGTATAQQAKLDVLRIGTSGSLTGEAPGGPKEKSGMDTLKSFIKDETGLDNEILREKDWQELAEQLAKKKLQLAVFQGYEFAWAREKYPDLKPLAVAVNVYKYPVAYVVSARTNPAKDFAGLKGQSLAVPASGAGFLRLFVERQSEANAKKANEFFSKITTADNVEDALDDLVDGKVQAVVVDRAGLEAYKRRKPGRFKQLKEVAQSKPFPPALVAYYDSALDEATLRRFKDGLLGAAGKEKGQTLLTLFRLTGFQDVPDDFDRVLADTRKAYPPPDAKTK
jgi:ABC-type phosphate/phosphonate transport system substrate-binding protein